MATFADRDLPVSMRKIMAYVIQLFNSLRPRYSHAPGDVSKGPAASRTVFVITLACSGDLTI